LVFARADQAAKPLVTAVEVGDDREFGAFDGLEQDRLLAGLLHGLGDGCELVARIDRTVHRGKLAAPRKILQEPPHVRFLSARPVIPVTLNRPRFRRASRNFPAPEDFTMART